MSVAGQLPPGGGYTGDEVEVLDLLRVLWRWKLMIVGGTLLCAVGSFMFSLSMTSVYEADLTLLVTSPKFQQNGSLVEPSVSNLVALMQNRGLVAEMLSDLGLDSIEPQAFIGGLLTVVQIPQTTMFRVIVRLPDPEHAAAAANRVGELTVQLNAELYQVETAASRDFIKQQLDHAAIRLAEIEDHGSGRTAEARSSLLEFDRTAQLRRVQNLFSVKLSDETGLEAAKTRLTGDVAALRARLSQTRSAISTTAQMLDAPTSITTDVPLNRSTSVQPSREDGENRRASVELPQVALHSSRLSPFLNPTYQVLDQDIVATEALLAEQTARLSQVANKLAENGAELERLQVEVVEKEARREELARAVGDRRASFALETSLARQSYSVLTAQYEQARIQVASRSAQIQIVDRAVVPVRRVAPRIRRNTQLALLVGLMISVVLAFLLEYVRSAEAKTVVDS